MAFTVGNNPGTYTISSFSSGTTFTKSVSISNAITGRYYHAWLRAGTSGNSTILASAGITASAYSTSISISSNNSALLTALDGRPLSWWFEVKEYTSLASYTGGSSQTSTNGSTSATITISLRHTATAVSSYNLDIGGVLSVTSTEPSDHAGWRSKFEIWVNGTHILTRHNYTSGNMNHTPTSTELASMLNAMGGVSPRTIQVRTFTGWNIGTTNQYYYSSYISGTNSITKTFVIVPSKNVGDNYPFSNYTSSYFYLNVVSSAPQSNGTYNITADVYVYAGQAISSKTITSFSCTIGGVAGARTINNNSLTISSGSAQKVETFTANVGPFNTRSPQVSLVTTLNITDVGNNGPRTATTAAGFMASIPALDANAIVIETVTNGSISILEDINTQVTHGEIAGNDFAFYKVRISESTNGTTFVNSQDSAIAANTKIHTWTNRAPYILYYYRFEIIGRDNASYGNVVVSQRANDNIPIINTFTMSSKSQTTVNVALSSTAVSPLTYVYSRKLSVDPSFTDVATTSSASYSFSGLTANTSYDFKVTATNTDGSVTSTGTAGNAANLTVTTSAGAPVIDSYTTVKTDTTIRITVSASVDDGLTATYSFGRRTGATTWTWTSYSATANYTFTGLNTGTAYDFQFKVKDSLGTETTSSIFTVSTLFPKPVISSVIASNISNAMATLKINTQNTQTTAISLYRFHYYAGTALPVAWVTGTLYTAGTVVLSSYFGYRCLVEHTAGNFSTDYNTNAYWERLEWTDRTSDSYLVAGLTSNTDYIIIARAVDNQAPPLSSDLMTAQFRTLAASQLSTVKSAKFVRTTQAQLSTIPIRDGTLIVVTDNGDIYLDINGSERRLISYGIKIYNAVKGVGDIYTITTNDFDNLDLSVGRTITFYMKPDITSGGSTPQLTLNGTTLDLTGLNIYKTDMTQMGLTAERLYLVSFNNSGVTPAFILVNY